MKVVITDHDFRNLDHERKILGQAGIDLVATQCDTPNEIIAAAHDADGLLVNRANVTSAVVEALEKCRIIVRYGIGYDNIDLPAATAHGIAVSNIPDYASGEVADHAVALALTLARQIPFIDFRFRSGTWSIVPDYPMPSFRDMRFVTLGYGRIASEVLRRARAFGFETAAHDPFVSPETMATAEVRSLTLTEAFQTADILSLHLPLNLHTRHVVNDASLATMKANAIIINTSRGGLIDTPVLASALKAETIFAAGLDVYESEPLPAYDQIRAAPRAMLTSHVAWYSDASAPRLQTMAAEEIVRGLTGQPLRSQLNKFNVPSRS